MEHSRNHFHNLKRQRKIRGYSLKEVSWLLGLKSAGRLSRWEQGKAMPSVKNLLMLSIAYRTLCDQLYFDYRKKLQVKIFEREQALMEIKKSKGHVEIM